MRGLTLTWKSQTRSCCRIQVCNVGNIGCLNFSQETGEKRSFVHRVRPYLRFWVAKVELECAFKVAIIDRLDIISVGEID